VDHIAIQIVHRTKSTPDCRSMKNHGLYKSQLSRECRLSSNERSGPLLAMADHRREVGRSDQRNSSLTSPSSLSSPRKSLTNRNLLPDEVENGAVGNLGWEPTRGPLCLPVPGLQPKPLSLWLTKKRLATEGAQANLIPRGDSQRSTQKVRQKVPGARHFN
jgi:hypothetical protein